MGIKKRKALAIFTAVVVLVSSLSACKNGGNSFVSANWGESVAAVDLSGISSFDFDKDGKIYTARTVDSGRVTRLDYVDGTFEDIPIYESELYIFENDGTEEKKYVFSEDTTPQNLVYKDNSVYYTVSTMIDKDEKQVLMKYTFGSETAEQVYVFDEYNTIKKIELYGEKLYILAVNSSTSGQDETGDAYFNSGEVLFTLDVNSFSSSVVMESGCVSFSINDDKLLVYAHDEKGFYLSVLNASDYTEESREYKDLNMLSCLTLCSDKAYCFSNMLGETGVGLFKQEGVINIFAENTYLTSYAKIFDNHIFYIDSNALNENHGQLLKIDISDALNNENNREIKMISAESIMEAPFSLGFLMTSNVLDYDSFALTLLSQDKNFDISILNSRQTFAASIRDKGSFYPLNEIDGVSEYINSCFPFLKEAATNSDGDIWMLPISVTVPTLSYNTQICDELGIDVSKINCEDLISLVSSMYADENQAKHIGEIYPYYYAELLASNYLLDNEKFDTALFRELAPKIKNGIFGNYDAFNTASAGLKSAYANGDYSSLAFSFTDMKSQHDSFSELGGGVREIPMLTDNQSSIASVVFICVNPSSENLEMTLAYIERLAKALSADKESFVLENSPIFSSNDYYSQLREIYANANARFSYDNEIFLENYYAYLEGETELDAFITVADRKLSAYLNE